MKIRQIKNSDNKNLEKIIKTNLEKFNLNIKGTAYFDKELSSLSEFYSENLKREYFVIVNEEEEVLGGVGIAEYDEDNNIAELQKLYLLEKAKNLGASYKLLDTAIEFAKNTGYKKIYLETHHNLKAALHLYKKYDFKEIERPLKIGEHNAMDIFLLKEI